MHRMKVPSEAEVEQMVKTMAALVALFDDTESNPLEKIGLAFITGVTHMEQAQKLARKAIAKAREAAL